MNEGVRIPAICVDRSAVPAFSLFNPNDWLGSSRGVVQSCATEFAVLTYTANRIQAICDGGRDVCSHHFETLRKQWQASPWDLSKVAYFGQVPELHILIEGFFAGLKSLLDLNSQLLATERVVGVAVNGFHRAKGVYGGVVINALENNVVKGKDPIATAVKALVTEHKALWIDAAIATRDSLVHPLRGAQQVMFEIRVENCNGSLVYSRAVPPHIGEIPMSQYAAEQVENAQEFSAALLRELKPPNKGMHPAAHKAGGG